MLRHKWKTWKATPAVDRIAFLEAIMMLAAARAVVAVGLRMWGKGLVRPPASHAAVAPEHACREVRRAIFLATKNIPWESLCLPNAIAGKWMLARRSFASTIHLGVGQHATGDLHAHAWLEAGGRVVLGQKGMETVTRITSRDLHHETAHP